MIHAHSREAWRTLDLGNREKEICAVLEHHGVMTDREICRALGKADMNYARPSITNLIEQGVLEEYDDVRCPETRMKVRRCYFGTGIPKAKPKTLQTVLLEYFKIAERERAQSLYACDEWFEAAENVNRLI